MRAFLGNFAFYIPPIVYIFFFLLVVLVVVRATPPQEGRKEADDEEDSEAGVMPTWGANPGLAGCVSPATHTLGPRVGTGLPAARWRRRV